MADALPVPSFAFAGLGWMTEKPRVDPVSAMARVARRTWPLVNARAKSDRQINDATPEAIPSRSSINLKPFDIKMNHKIVRTKVT